MSEYRGLIIEVFKVDKWYRKECPYSSGNKVNHTHTAARGTPRLSAFCGGTSLASQARREQHQFLGVPH